MTGRGDGIDPAALKRMAAQYPSGTEQAPAKGAVAFNGFLRITGAAGVKPAALAQMWANNELVALD
jgi:hypothetical protein